MKTTGQRIITLLLITAIACCSLINARASSVEFIDIMTAEQLSLDPPYLYVGIKLLDKTGNSVLNPSQLLSFKANDVPVRAADSAASSTGHILLIDTSQYYFRTGLHIDVVKNLARAVLQQIPSGHLVYPIAVDDSGVSAQGWLSVSQAEAWVNGLVQSKTSTANLFDAIYQGMQMAMGSSAKGPAGVSSVFVITDGMLDGSNPSDSIKILNMPNQIRNVSFVIAWPDWKPYVGANRQSLSDGLLSLRTLAEGIGGVLVDVDYKPLTDRAKTGTLDTSGLARAVSAAVRSVSYYTLDLSPLVGAVSYTEKDAILLDVEAGGLVKKVSGIPFDTRQVPSPTPTPAPTPEPLTPEPVTPVPAPTQVVVLEQADTNARKAIKRLQDLYYLPAGHSVGEFDVLAQLAYDEFCRAHGIKETDGVSSEGWALLNSSMARPAPTATPTPTPTPVPTPSPSPTPVPTAEPLRDLYIGDSDLLNGNDHIRSFQAVLRRLGIFDMLGLDPEPGMFDTPTLDAVKFFSESYRVKNSAEQDSGISAAVQAELLEREWVALTPTPAPTAPPTPAPTAWTEGVKTWMSSNMYIGSFAMPNWLLVVICAALVLGIIILVILLRANEKSKKAAETGISQTNSQAQAKGGPQRRQEKENAGGSGDETQPNTDNDSTVPIKRGGRVITLTVEYAGSSKEVYPDLSAGAFTIGRKGKQGGEDYSLCLDARDKSVSRPHAELYAVTDQIYLRDVGSTNGTFVNEQKIPGASESGAYRGDSEATMPLDAAGGFSGWSLSRGDVIRIGNHRLTINW